MRPRSRQLFRTEWMDALAGDERMRLLWYLNHAMGSGPSYQVVTITALTDGEAWEALTQRTLNGDMSELMAGSTSVATRSTGSWSCRCTGRRCSLLDLGSGTHRWTHHELSIYMQDTGWPHAPLDDYIELSGTEDYWQIMRQVQPDKKLLDILACFPWPTVRESDPRRS